MSHDCDYFSKWTSQVETTSNQLVNLMTDPWDDWYSYKHLPSKSTIRVGKYTIPWILWESVSGTGHIVLFLGRSTLDHGLKGRNSTTCKHCKT